MFVGTPTSQIVIKLNISIDEQTAILSSQDSVDIYILPSEAITSLLSAFSLVVDRDLLKDTHTGGVKSMSDHLSRLVLQFFPAPKSFNKPFVFIAAEGNAL